MRCLRLWYIDNSKLQDKKSVAVTEKENIGIWYKRLYIYILF